MNKKTRWGDQYRGGVMLDINHNAWRIYNNCRPFSSLRPINKEYILRLVDGFLTDKMQQISQDLAFLLYKEDE